MLIAQSVIVVCVKFLIYHNSRSIILYTRHLWQVNPTGSSTLSGLCGNANGVQEDDWRLRSGQLATSTVDLFNSWSLPGAACQPPSCPRSIQSMALRLCKTVRCPRSFKSSFLMSIEDNISLLLRNNPFLFDILIVFLCIWLNFHKNFFRFPPLNKCKGLVNSAAFESVCLQQTCQCLLQSDGDERGCK